MAKFYFIKSWMVALVLALSSGLMPACNMAAAADILIYSDSLLTGWENWSWNTGLNFSSTSPVHSGSYSLSVTYNSAWAGLYLHADAAVDLSGYDHLSFWLNGGSGNQHLKLIANGDGGNAYQVAAQSNAWTQVNVPLSALGSPATLSDLYWEDTTGGAQPMFYLDDIVLVARTGPPPPPPPRERDRD